VKARYWIILALAVSAGLLGWALVPRLLGSGSAVGTEEAFAVVVAAPRTGQIERALRYPGTLRPAGTVTVLSKIPGRIEGILVEEGQLVGGDELLVRIEDTAVRLQMQQAYAAWQAAEAQYDKARRGVRAEELENARALYQKASEDLATAEESFQRSERLYRSGTIAKAQYEEAESRLRSARTELENAGRTLKMLEEGASPEEQEMARSQARAARASYELARLQVEDTEIRAPVAGSIARILQDEGNTVGGSVPILVLVQDDPIFAEAAVPERHYGELIARKQEVQCRVRPAAYPGADPFVGTISEIAPTIDPGSRTFAVTVKIPNPQLVLRPGMYAEVELVVERREQALLVPETAVLERDRQSVVFVIGQPAAGPNGGGEAAARQREVRVGLSTPGVVEIVEGIALGDLVIVEGNAFLEDGQRVRILERR
jgi:RND family efflux transporter MFP subunit